MRRDLKRLVLGIAAFALAATLGACSGDRPAETDTPSAGTVDEQKTDSGSAGNDDTAGIVIGIPQDLEDSLDPHEAVAAGTKEILFNIYEGLIKPDSNGDFLCALAESYDVVDGRTLEFVLRDGVIFHDGSILTTEDVVYSLEKCRESNAAFENLESIQVEEPGRVILHLKEEDTEFLPNMTVAIVKAGSTDLATVPNGTGPYKYISRSPQENLILESFDQYWGEPAFIKNVTIKVISNADMIVTELNGGGVDMMARITAAQAAALGEDFRILKGSMNLVNALYLNNAKAPFDNKLLRQALCYATDKQELFDLAFDGEGNPIGSMMFPAFGKYYMDELNDVYGNTADIEAAKKCLEEAGYPGGFSFTVRVPSNYQQYVDSVQVLKEQYSRVGINMEIEPVEWATWLEDVYAGRNYQATMVGVDAPQLTAQALLGRFTSDSGKNFINYSNSEYDDSYGKAASAVEDSVKTTEYKHCQELLTEDAASVYIQDLVSLVALRKGYNGFEFYPLYVLDFAKLNIK